jgi:outer membrane protein TolC
MSNRPTSSPLSSVWLLRPAMVGSMRRFSLLLSVIFLTLFAPSAHAQISLTTAVDLALRINPRVQGAQADVLKANSQVSQTLDAYVPSITVGAGLGQAYGFSPNPPTLATVSGGGLVFNASQSFYIRSARAGLNAAQLALEDARESVAQDAALAFIALNHDQQREEAIGQQAGYANALATIVQTRVDAGQDSPIDLTQAKLTAAELRVAILKAHDDVAYDREHLARLIGLSPAVLSIDTEFPVSSVAFDASEPTAVHGYANAAVASAFASAEARRQQAAGEARYHFWPEFNLVAQYQRYATFTESFAALQKLNGTIKANEGVFGVQITLPILDKGHSAKARESAATAARALHDAQSAQMDALDGQSRLRHSLSELQAQGDVATLQQQLAQEQLDATRLQLQSGSGDPNRPQMTPKDEQKARIAERDKYLAVIDARFQLRQAEIQLLRQTGDLETWLKSANARPATVPAPQQNLPAQP